MNLLEQSKVFKALCDEKRLEIIKLLLDGEKCACVLLDRLDFTQSGLSYQMKILCESGIVKDRREGKWVHYSIDHETCKRAADLLLEITGSNAEGEMNLRCLCGKKALFITGQKADSTGSGIYISEIIKAFKKRGIEVSLISMKYKEDKGKDDIREYPIIANEDIPFLIPGMSDKMPYKSTCFKDMTKDMLSIYDEAFKKKIEEVILKENPDFIVSNHLYRTTAIAADMDIPVYAICHGSDLRQLMKNPCDRDNIIKKLEKLKAVFSLHKEQKSIIEKIIKIPDEKIFISGVGYNACIFNDEGRDIKKNRIVFAGKISIKKGVLSLVRSMKYLKNPEKIELILAGGAGCDDELSLIKEAISKTKASIRLLGAIDQVKLSGIFKTSKVFILPSFYEGLPLVNLEALASGCRVISTNLPGIRAWYDENIKNNEIIYVDPPKMKNVDDAYDTEEFERDLAKAIEKALVEDKSSVITEHLSWDNTGEKIIDVIKKTL